MSTKINVRSPFYLNLTEPVVPLPIYDCIVADLRGFAIDNQGVITEPTPRYGIVYSFTSADAGFANGKFATVTTPTERLVTFTVTIPAGFSNTSDLYLECGQHFTQPASTTCTPSVTTSGSIPSQSLPTGGSTVDIDLSGYFTGETKYAVNNNNPALITTALSGSTLTLTTNGLAGSATIYALGRDNSYPTTCEAVQPISITVTAAGVDFDCTPSPLLGGSIAADGTITRPVSIAQIQGVSLTNGGALLSPETVAANTGSASQPVTLWFKLTAPTGYNNAGSTVWCSSTLTQAGTAPLIFNCTIASLTGQKIATDGSISLGTAAYGTVKSFTPPNPPFGTVSTNTTRIVEFQVEIPSGYADAGTEINCPREIIQPATIPVCGLGVGLYISVGKPFFTDFCDSVYSAFTFVTSSAANINTLLGSQICKNGSPFNGKNYYYIVTGYGTAQAGGIGIGSFYSMQVDSNGIVMDLEIAACQGSTGSGTSIQL